MKRLILTLSLAAALTTVGCAAFKPTEVNGPRAEGPEYPVELSELGTRLEEASLAWYQLSQRYGLAGKTQVNLHPYTATLESLPANLPSPIYLPKVGSQTNPTEEEVRESLRRFIVEWQRLIGAEPKELSLVERVDEPSGVKLARYEQRPFRYSLRGGYGTLVIRFRTDGQLVGLSSNCIPHADSIQATLANLTPKVTGERAVDRVKSQPITITDRKQTVSLPPNATVEARQLVVYASPSKDPPSGLQIRVAWEIDVANGPITKVYLDAISEEIIATS
ncbi:MAG TPA: hypothetical protein VFP64_10355 [Pyrinomonadaceae bacterium]|nr:hypothetical protein [Pyrinomonadaceae bacterium]